MTIRHNQQLATWASNNGQDRLETGLVDGAIPPRSPDEILVEILAVPLHGSFWLATHPEAIHPRRDEFLANGRFVFGNGGIGRVVESFDDGPSPGAHVAIFGHVPCSHPDCTACRVEHRYVECPYGESTILGHGKGAREGTLARYAILPRYSYEVFDTGTDPAPIEDLLPYMYAFLLADVRNALTRDPHRDMRRRLLLIGAGQSGHLAAWLHLNASPDAQVVVVDPSTERTASIAAMRPGAVATVELSAGLVECLNRSTTDPRTSPDVTHASARIADAMRHHFGGRLADVVFDASSGNSTPLWDNAAILAHGCHCVPFGFGSRGIMLSPSVLQRSGLSLVTSRGVGDLANRRAVIDLLTGDLASLVRKSLIERARRLDGLEVALEFVRQQHASGKLPSDIPHAYLVPGASRAP